MGLKILMQSVTVEELKTITENIPGRPDQHVRGVFGPATTTQSVVDFINKLVIESHVPQPK